MFRMRNSWRKSLSCLSLTVVLCSLKGCNCFGLSTTTNHNAKTVTGRREKLNTSWSHTKSRSQLYYSKNSNEFDLSKPTFDLFSLRSIRNDALLQYNSLNQSEPLRINLYLLLTVVTLSFPSLSEAVLGEALNDVVSNVASKVAALGSAALFVRECQARSLQLSRFERELNAEFLKIRLAPSTPFATNRPSSTLQQLRGSKRILVLAGNQSSLETVLPLCFALGQRLQQSNTIIVPVLANSSTNRELLPSLMSDKNIESLRRQPWFAEPLEIQEWKTYLDDLSLNNDSNEADGDDNLRWFGLNYNGRSFASGRQTSSFRLLEIMGQNLRPSDILDLEPSIENNAKQPTLLMTNKKDDSDNTNEELQKLILGLQSEFYDALTNGNLPAIQNIFAGDETSPYKASEVSEILELGGRIDPWSMCLQEDARPANMLTSNPDVCVVSDKLIYSTILEFPSMGGGDSYSSGNIGNASLLAIQRWRLQTDGAWKLELHQTIPWNPDTKAGGTLRCDGRGCVALTRGNDRRTFGGIIG